MTNMAFEARDDFGLSHSLAGATEHVRLGGEGKANVNYRHFIGSLVRKPGALARYRFREQLFLTMHFCLTYDVVNQWPGVWVSVPAWRERLGAETLRQSAVVVYIGMPVRGGCFGRELSSTVPGVNALRK